MILTSLAYNTVRLLANKVMLYYIKLEVRGPSGPQLLVGSPSGRLDFVLRTLEALRPFDPRNDVVIG